MIFNFQHDRAKDFEKINQVLSLKFIMCSMVVEAGGLVYFQIIKSKTNMLKCMLCIKMATLTFK